MLCTRQSFREIHLDSVFIAKRKIPLRNVRAAAPLNLEGSAPYSAVAGGWCVAAFEVSEAMPALKS